MLPAFPSCHCTTRAAALTLRGGRQAYQKAGGAPARPRRNARERSPSAVPARTDTPAAAPDAWRAVAKSCHPPSCFAPLLPRPSVLTPCTCARTCAMAWRAGRRRLLSGAARLAPAAAGCSVNTHPLAAHSLAVSYARVRPWRAGRRPLHASAAAPCLPPRPRRPPRCRLSRPQAPGAAPAAAAPPRRRPSRAFDARCLNRSLPAGHARALPLAGGARGSSLRARVCPYLPFVMREGATLLLATHTAACARRRAPSAPRARGSCALTAPIPSGLSRCRARACARAAGRTCAPGPPLPLLRSFAWPLGLLIRAALPALAHRAPAAAPPRPGAGGAALFALYFGASGSRPPPARPAGAAAL